MKEAKIYYFDKTGKENTENVVEAVKQRIVQGGISHIVCATTTGYTPTLLHNALKESNIPIVAVGYHAGFSGGDKIRPDAEARQKLEKMGIPVYIGSHALSGVGRSITKKFGGVTPVEIIAHTLRTFGGHGTKVAVEVAVMAADAGLVPTDSDIIAIGGTSRGADAAIVLKAAHMNNFFDLVIKEFLAKPISGNA